MIKLRVDQQAVAVLRPTDSRGFPAPVENVEWLAEPDGLLLVEPSADGLTALVRPTGLDLGTVQVQVTADARLGEGVRTITGTASVEIIGGEAVTLRLELEAPTDLQAEPTPTPEPVAQLT